MREPCEQAGWSERHSFDFYDRARDVSGIISIAIWPNASLKEMHCHFLMPDGSTVSLEGNEPCDKKTLHAKGLRFDMTEPEKRWRIAFAGGMERTTERRAKKSHVELDLGFDALNEAFEYHPCAQAQSGVSPARPASERVEQVGRFTGKLSTGLDDFQIDALGGRSHARGMLDWTVYRSWMRFACRFSEGHALSFMKLVTDEGATDAGFVFQGGRNVPVVGADLNVNMDFGKNPKSFDMTLRDSEGGGHKVFGSVIKRVGIRFRSQDERSISTVNTTVARYTLGGKSGYGVAEFLGESE